MGRRLLVVDDDNAFRALVATSVEVDGHEVVEARDVAEAAALFDAHRYDLLVVDGLLPDGTGVELLEAARAHGVRAPAIFVSGAHWSQATLERLKHSLGVVLAIRKPVSAGELGAQLAAVLARDAVTPEPPPEPSGLLRSDVRARLAALDEAFAQKLSGRVAELGAALTAASAGDLAALRRAHHLAHKLHGSAGSYGLAEAGQAAALIEELLAPAVAEGGPASPDAWGRVEPALARLAGGAPAEALPRRATATPLPLSGALLVVATDERELEAIGVVAARLLLRVLHAADRGSALAQARRQRPDAAVLDLRLTTGGEGAVSLARQLRALPGLSEMPVAFICAEGDLATRLAAVHAGGNMCLVGHQDPVALEHVLGRLTALESPTHPRVLVLDDDADFTARLALDLGGAPVELLVLNDPQRVLERLGDVRPDLLLLDVVLGAVSGFDICRVLRSSSEWHDLPVIFVSARESPDARLACFRAGGDDFLPKPVEPEELVARIAAHAGRLREHRLEAMRDPLTGLLTRRAFADAATVRLSEARRLQRPVSLVFVDLDHFKLVNDTHGHLTGDRVLAGIGQLLRSHLRTEDARGRWGGEEFALCIFGQEAGRAHEILGRAQDEFRQLAFESPGGATFGVTFSAGVASFPEDGDSLEGLLEVADRRLYAAKQTGRDRIVSADA